MINQISFQIIQKSHVILLNKNFKLEEKYYINKRAHLGTEKKFVLHHSLKIKKQGVLISSGGEVAGLENIEKLISVSHVY